MQMMKKNNWSASGFGKNVSPDLVSDEFLDTEVIILLQGNNLFGDAVYSYLQITGRNLKDMFSKMRAGENFKPADFGDVVRAGKGDPTDEVREEMKIAYNMIDVPMPKQAFKPLFQPKSFNDE